MEDTSAGERRRSSSFRCRSSLGPKHLRHVKVSEHLPAEENLLFRDQIETIFLENSRAVMLAAVNRRLMPWSRAQASMCSRNLRATPRP
ncbi:hypothetical protein [Brevundimonas sp. NIBR10]|uniref:hypothetical protein n=1 Tax=Brevundimonas sp. NIBR10 TaxID=3015997 RepID=UPI0022F18827|nr:hypothetical protein [Brevundimonas sp. NIBR10]